MVRSCTSVSRLRCSTERVCRDSVWGATKSIEEREASITTTQRGIHLTPRMGVNALRWSLVICSGGYLLASGLLFSVLRPYGIAAGLASALTMLPAGKLRTA